MSAALLQYVSETAHWLRAELGVFLAESDWLKPEDQREYLVRPVAETLTEALRQLQATGCQGPANQLPSQVLWNIVGDLLRHGVLQLRAREKPRGYAGDDVLLNLIFYQEVTTHRLGCAFDRFFQQQDAPQAVRERIRYAATLAGEALKQAVHPGGCRIAVIGAGPAIEIELALRKWFREPEEGRGPAFGRVTLLDLDEEALTAATARLTRLLPDMELVAVRENLFRIGRQPQRAAPLAESNLIICLGLLDYLNAEDAAALLRVAYQSLRPGGRMLFGNFSPQCQARAYMEWIGNWYLTYRTREEFTTLALAAGISPQHFQLTGLVDEACLLLEATRG